MQYQMIADLPWLVTRKQSKQVKKKKITFSNTFPVNQPHQQTLFIVAILYTSRISKLPSLPQKHRGSLQSLDHAHNPVFLIKQVESIAPNL